MTRLGHCLLLLGLLAHPTLAQTDTPIDDAASTSGGSPDDVSDRRIEALIVDLDDEDFAVRRRAERELIRIGRPAWFPVLAASRTGSLERRVRTRTIVETLQPRVSDYAFADVSKKGNQELAKGFFGSETNHLATVPQGRTSLGGVQFDIGPECIQLISTSSPKTLPVEVEDIPAKGTCDRVHFLHGTHWGSPRGVPDGKEIGWYDVHYIDGATVRVPIEYGHDIRDWWNWDRSRPSLRAKEVWTGINPNSANYKGNRVMLRLFLRTWENTRPDVAIERIDFGSTNDTISAPFCVAISLETPPKHPSLNGRWRVVSSLVGGRDEKQAIGREYVFETNTLTFTATDGRRMTATCERDRTTAPATIDLRAGHVVVEFEEGEEATPAADTAEGEPLENLTLGLYTIDEDRLTLYWGKPSESRPKTTSARDPLVDAVVVLERVLEEPP